MSDAVFKVLANFKIQSQHVYVKAASMGAAIRCVEKHYKDSGLMSVDPVEQKPQGYPRVDLFAH